MDPTNPDEIADDDDLNTQPQDSAGGGSASEAALRAEVTRLRAERRTLREENEKLKRSSAEPKQQPEPPADKVKLDNGQTVTREQFDRLQSQFQQIQERDQMADLARGLDISLDQAKAVFETMRENPGLKPHEAKTIASVRNAELFAVQDQRGFNPAIHSSLRPSGGAPVQAAEERAKVIEDIAKTPDRLTRDEKFQKFIGAQARRVLGLEPRR